jgi:hypothetical protein
MRTSKPHRSQTNISRTEWEPKERHGHFVRFVIVVSGDAFLNVRCATLSCTETV